MKKWLWPALIVTCVSIAHATYNANIVGGMVSILTYNDGMLLFTIANQPTANGSCNAIFFELDPVDATDDAAFNRRYARLAQAYAMGEQVNIGFDDAANFWRLWVHPRLSDRIAVHNSIRLL